MKCARTACNSDNAVLPHKQNGKLYCPRCARKINEYNGGVLFDFPKPVAMPTEQNGRVAGKGLAAV